MNESWLKKKKNNRACPQHSRIRKIKMLLTAVQYGLVQSINVVAVFLYRSEYTHYSANDVVYHSNKKNNPWPGDIPHRADQCDLGYLLSTNTDHVS